MHSVRQLLLNLGAAVQISWLPFGLVAAAAIWALSGTSGVVFGETVPIEQVPPGFIPKMLLLAVVTLFCFIWVAVNWHRFVLLAEYPSWFGAPPRVDRMLSYLGTSVLIILMVIVLLIVLSIASVLLFPVLQIPLLGPLANVLLGAVLSAIIFRMSMPLPAVSIGEQMTFGEGFEVTRGSFLPIVVLAFLISMLSAIPQFLIETPLAPIVTSAAYMIASQWLIAMLGISVLTTLYGYFVERRELLA